MGVPGPSPASTASDSNPGRRLDHPPFFSQRSPIASRRGDLGDSSPLLCMPSMKAHVSTFALALGLVVAPTARGAGGFGSPVVVTGLDTGEPGIDVAADGTIYVNAPAGLLSNLPGSPSFVFRSDDGGATWTLTPPGSRASLPGGGDSDLSVDPATGALYMTDLWLGSATVSRSTDRGASWLANPLEGVVVQDRQWVASAGGGNVYHATHQIPLGLVVSKSAAPADGLVYPVSTVAATPVDQTGCVCPPGNLTAEPGTDPLGSGDRVGLVYATSTGGIKFARSTNGAISFTNVAVSPASSADTTPAFPVVASAGHGSLHAVWLEVFGTASSRIGYARSADWGASWTKPVILVSGGASVYPWVAAGGSKVSVTLYHTAAGGTPDTAAEGSQWFETYLESTDGGTTFSPLAIIDSVPVKSGPICTQGIDCSGDRELLDFQSVTLDGAGRANAVWTRSIDGVSDTEIRFARQ